MAKRLRARLMQARAAVERDIGHSLAVAVPCPDPEGRPERSVGSDGHRFPQTHGQTRALDAHAHSYPHKDRSPLRARALLRGSAAPTRRAARNPALVKAASSRDYLDLPSSPPIARTPPRRHGSDDDNDNEIAHTILLLATPPALHSQFLFEPNSRHRPHPLDTTPTPGNRRLSFSRCVKEPSAMDRQQLVKEATANTRDRQDWPASLPATQLSHAQPAQEAMPLRPGSRSRSRSRSASASTQVPPLPAKPARKRINAAGGNDLTKK
ncbi:hypothetical protein FB645_005279 [Coemansia sp. IMI 203386]|nr:hypothetical protein FB645_005279 [Coemansia sp. IMI 203386]